MNSALSVGYKVYFSYFILSYFPVDLCRSAGRPGSLEILVTYRGRCGDLQQQEEEEEEEEGEGRKRRIRPNLPEFELEGGGSKFKVLGGGGGRGRRRRIEIRFGKSPGGAGTGAGGNKTRDGRMLSSSCLSAQPISPACI